MHQSPLGRGEIYRKSSAALYWCSWRRPQARTTMAKALINNKIVSWALDRANISTETLAKRTGVKPEVIDAWLEGSALPTFAQAQRAAGVLSIPFGYLYLSSPPVEEMPVPNFRTVGGERSRLDVDTKALLADVFFKRDWYREYREHAGYDPIAFVGKYGVEARPTEVASDIAFVLHGSSARPKTANWESYLQLLMNRAEAVGIWVMRTGIVGNNTHRPLSISQFRGLAIADSILPLILINGQDSKAAQIFTFAHELAHIWVGESGISSVQLEERDVGPNTDVERFCNKVAAEFLTPVDEFRSRWLLDRDLSEQVDALAYHFKVSRIVVARRARDLNFVSDEVYRQFFAQERRKWLEASASKGGDFNNTLPIRNGRDFTRSVVSQAMAGGLLFRQAASLLGVKPAKVREIYEGLRN